MDVQPSLCYHKDLYILFHGWTYILLSVLPQGSVYLIPWMDIQPSLCVTTRICISYSMCMDVHSVLPQGSVYHIPCMDICFLCYYKDLSLLPYMHGHRYFSVLLQGSISSSIHAWAQILLCVTTAYRGWFANG